MTNITSERPSPANAFPTVHNTDTTSMRTWIEVDLGAIAHNVKEIRSRKLEQHRHHVHFMAIVKANAYGHGAYHVARAALEGGASHLGVAYVEEGIDLRNDGISDDVPILAVGPCLPGVLRPGIRHNISFSIGSITELQNVVDIARKEDRTAHVHLSVDTGMGRTGFTLEELREGVSMAVDAGDDVLSVDGVFTHFSCADESDPSFTKEQIRLMRSALDIIKEGGLKPPIVHMCNSPGTLLYPEAHMDLVRVGISLYGMRTWNPSRDGVGLKQAFTWKTRLAYVGDRDAEWPVSYGRRFRCPEGCVLGVVPVGYRDGYARSFTGNAWVSIRGRRVPVVGTVTMDWIVLDLTGMKNDAGNDHNGETSLPKVGDEVVVVGEGAKPEDLAEASGTISYEITTRVQSHLPRIYVPLKESQNFN